LISIRYINQLFSGKYLGGVFNGSSCYFVLYIVLPSSAHNHRKFSSTAAVCHCSDDVVKTTTVTFNSQSGCVTKPGVTVADEVSRATAKKAED